RREFAARRHRAPDRAFRNRALRGCEPPRHGLRTRLMNEIRNILKTMEYGPAPESDAYVAAWLDRKGRRFGHFIAGRFDAPGDEDVLDVFNPANGENLAEVAIAGTAAVDAAVKAAGSALQAWHALGCDGRARHLYAIARHVQ